VIWVSNLIANNMNTQKGLAPIIIALIIAIVFGGGYVVISQSSKGKNQNLGEKKEEKKTQEVKTDETADWKTYRNEKYGFELQYPRAWKNCSLGAEKNYEKSAVQLLCIEQEIPGDQLGLSKVIRLLIDPEKVSALNTYKKLVQYLKTGHETARKVGLYSVFKEGSVGSVSFVQSGAGDVGTWGNFYIFLKSHILAVGYNNAADIAEQILSTFKFTK